ncbi:class I SAM-dependent methyltransferase [Acanthopleuribacter pedis]|uniref:Class I SAM-dependent methyltransferase n=1 Tax=Acanthopleuribacter pedis TaxID=442870 RepID=A0A8J7QHF1_9BACT|nr:class I SAM-dependent methyltransferase [Acanthopleuribacter pedis]MBO1320531.1 class I SAM-dependent methyltransferase [Acanthopleuribacter pedis]
MLNHTLFLRGTLLLMTALVSVFAGDSLEAIADGAHRSAEHKARNGARHPAETLAFFGLKPNMTVIEIHPGDHGWYTEVIAPYLQKEGTYIAMGHPLDSDNKWVQRGHQRFAEKLAANPIYNKVQRAAIRDAKAEGVAPGSADMVLTFRNVHNFITHDGNPDGMFAMFYGLLKPGGILGVVQHRDGEKAAAGPLGERGYLSEAVVIALAEKAGFQLAGKSEINANPKDTKDHPYGVWTLPPTLYHKDKDADRTKWQAIGESDRMTLKFVKPGKGA